MMKPNIDLHKYMGPWFVIAAAPTFYEKKSFNPVESYHLNADGTIENYYYSNRKSFDGPRKKMKAKARVVKGSNNSQWKVTFFWVFTFAYEIFEVGKDYEYTVVVHPSKKFFWIMARQNKLSPTLLNEIKTRLWSKGYDITKLQLAPQRYQDPAKMQVA